MMRSCLCVYGCVIMPTVKVPVSLQNFVVVTMIIRLSLWTKSSQEPFKRFDVITERTTPKKYQVAPCSSLNCCISGRQVHTVFSTQRRRELNVFNLPNLQEDQNNEEFVRQHFARFITLFLTQQLTKSNSFSRESGDSLHCGHRSRHAGTN